MPSNTVRLTTLLGVFCSLLIVQTAYAQTVDSVLATGPEIGSTLEDRVEISWTTAATPAITSAFVISRSNKSLGIPDTVDVGLVAFTEALYEDFSAVPGVEYDYCVAVRDGAGVETMVGCDVGTRVIARPTGFEATDGLHEEWVALTWSDQSQIETGFNLYRDAGNAIEFDGVDDYVSVPGTTTLPSSFTVEFWARRGATGDDEFIVNLENSPQGDPTSDDLEIGFDNADRFVLGFGSDQLKTPGSYSDSDWHHWAVTYDAGSRRRTIYVDGVEVAFDTYGQPFQSSGVLEFGRQSTIGNQRNRGHFSGQVDEMRLWSLELGPIEIPPLQTSLLRGTESGLVAQWPMDVSSGGTVPDVVGSLTGSILDDNGDASDWVPTGLADYYVQIPANLTSYSDRTSVSSFQSYTYRLAAFEDADGDGIFETGTDYVSDEQSDNGWRASLSPPSEVMATDGQFLDRVRITWFDRSDSETSFRIYRDGGFVGSVAPDSTIFDDFDATTTHQYCVAASNGVESIQVCDYGQPGNLPAPDSVKATDRIFDDLVLVSWDDTTDTEDGFEVFRDGSLVGTTGENAEEFSDLSAVQEEDYLYCVRAYSNADPGNPSYSSQLCAPTTGARAAVLPPEAVAATDNDFEDRIDLSWGNPSSTVMLYKLYREDTLIQVLDFRMTRTTDTGIPSDSALQYCVVSETVVAPAGASAIQGQVSKVLENIQYENTIRAEQGGAPTSPEVSLETVYQSLGFDAVGKNSGTGVDGFVESAPVCDTGSRLISAPTDVDATDDEFESHVQLTWIDNSQVEAGYYLFRAPVGNAPVPFDTLSPNRTTYGDYTGVPGVGYTYVVQAFDNYDTSSPDDDPGKRTLNPPTGLEASDGISENVVALDWIDHSDAELGYHIYRRIFGAPDSMLVGDTGTNEPAYTDTIPNASLGFDFEYIVTAFDDYGQSIAATDVGRTLLESPANVNASDTYDDRVTLIWVDRSGVEDMYRLTRRPVGSGAVGIDMMLPALTTMYTDNTAAANVEYEYCVFSVLQPAGGDIFSDPTCDTGGLLSTAGGPGGTGGLQAVRVTTLQETGFLAIDLRFGAGVALDGDNALIGAPGVLLQGGGFLGGFIDPSSYSGVVHRYRFAPAVPQNWILEEHWPGPLNILDLDVRHDYGNAVDLSGQYAAVGAPFLDDPRGTYGIWENQSTIPTFQNWTETRRSSSTILGNETGYSVGIDANYAIIGNPGAAPGLPSGHGSALVCDAEQSAGPCTTSANLALALDTPDRKADAEFGFSVDIVRVVDTLYAIVGAPGDDRAWIFKCDNPASSGCAATANWDVISKINTRFSQNRQFGAGVSINADLAVIGSPVAEGMVIYERTGGSWIEKDVYSPPNQSKGFGSAIALHDSTIVVGAPGEEIAEYENAGAIYVFQWGLNANVLSEPIRYDARVAGKTLGSPGVVAENAMFGASVDVSDSYYLVGAPMEEDNLVFTPGTKGAAYFIPVGLEPPDFQIVPPGVDLASPSEIEASDGTAPDRIQVRWDDESDDEEGHLVFRSDAEGELELLKEVGANIELFDDFEAAPGDAYTYCVAAFYADTITDMRCDIGWRPANGTIAGRIGAQGGGGVEEALVCLSPNPAKSLLFDGFGGHVAARVGDELDFLKDFTIEAWIRPHAVDGVRYIASKDSAWALALNNGRLRLSLFDNLVSEVDAVHSPISAGQWHHVAASMDNDLNVTFYLDGVPESAGTVNNFANPIGDTLAIGQQGHGTGFFKGEIDEVRVWHPARPDSLVAAAHRVALEGDEENLVGYWPLDQGRRRVAPDVSEVAGHGNLIDGVYLADEGAPLDVCALTVSEGNYSIAGIRYGESTEFNVIPSRIGREFEPSFKKITLTTESPVQNEVAFTDITAYPIAGIVQYQDIFGPDTLTCAVPEVRIHVDKGGVATDENVRTTTGGDGSYVVAVDPSIDNQDPWFIIPQYVDPDDDQVVHSFSPTNAELLVNDPVFDLTFDDLTRYNLTGHFSGGDPDLCGMDIGKAIIRIYTQDGCYSRLDTVDSAVDHGLFTFDLPPLDYLIEIVDIMDSPPERAEEIDAFFERLGTVEVDMRKGDTERNLIYRAPLVLSVEGLDPPVCPGDQIVQYDEDGNILRTLPEVPKIGAFQFVPLTFRVREDYGNDQFCDVDEGQIAIFDAIADRVDVDTTVALENGVAEYVTYGATPNIISGARIQGIDRSYQKPITVVAMVEGRDFLTETRWALVEGVRERAATFVSATTEEFPLMIVHDPPGSNSYAFLEEGSTFCSSIGNTKMLGGGAGVELDLQFGFTSELVLAPFGLGIEVETGGGFAIGGRVVAGQDVSQLQDGKPNREICLTTTEAFTTSDDPTWVGEDIHIGVALNLIFAIADVLEFDAPMCEVDLYETLAADLDQSDPFETSYAYGASHIALSLIPELENLIKLAGGDAGVSGTIDGDDTTIRLEEALQNWNKQLENSDDLQTQALSNPDVNRSFSGGTEFSFSEAADTTSTTRFESTRIYIDAEGHVGGVFDLLKWEQHLYAVFEVRSEWVHEEQDTEASSKAMGYVLKDGDTGDYFSVDIAKDPRYNTFVFGTQSGRSSNPHEGNTQPRDAPHINVDPPVLYNVDPEDAGRFELTLINASESNERRRYTMAIPGETNPRNLGVTVTGDLLGGNRLESFLIDPGKAITINMDVFPSPSSYSYNRVGVAFYPEDEFNIWLADVRQPFALADTAFFSVFFDSTGGGAMAAPMAEGWTWFSTNREGGDVNTVLERLNVTEGDIIRSQSAESRYDSTAGWKGTLTTLTPGEGYRVKLKESTVFRIEGEAVQSDAPIKLKSGWNWIGYLPAKRLPLNYALASLKDRVKPGDIIVGQDKFAQYVNGVGWVGTLQEMSPGESYAIDLAVGGNLLYPTSDEGAVRPTIRASQRTTQGPVWEIEPERFDGAMTMVAEVRLGGESLTQTTTKVAVFAGDSLRGVGEIDYVESLDRYLAFVLVYGITAEEDLEELRVHVYDGENDIVYEDVGSLEYATQTMLGQPADPVVLELNDAGKAPQLMELPEAFELYGNYPNPFNPTTTIAYDLPDAVHVNLTVFDVLGRQVVTLSDREHRAGRHKVTFDAGKLASGFYLYRLEAGDFVQTHKMILTK